MIRIGTIATLLLLLASCRSATNVEDWGGFLLSNQDYKIQHNVSGREHILLLERVAERNAISVTKWDVLDTVRVRMAQHEFLCLGPTFRAGTNEEVVVTGIEDALHTHKVERVWGVDLTLGRLVPADTGGIVCEVEECGDE